MSSLPSDLEAPVLLIAMPQVLDPYFHRSVVLLLHHEDEGSVGFIVNRTTEIRVAEILQGMEVTWGGESALKAYFGGPVQPQLGSVLCVLNAARHAELEDELAASEIQDGLWVTQHLGDLQQLAEEPPERFRLVLGYAGWGEGQLMEEIERNDWLVAPVDEELVFGEPGAVWTQALRSVGVDPAALQSWPTGGGDAN